jgi:hypothetical protein
MGLDRYTLVKVKSSQCARIERTLWTAFGVEAIIIDFFKATDLIPRDRLLMKLAASGVDSRVVIWVR